jgi:hypothetical protein
VKAESCPVPPSRKIAIICGSFDSAATAPAPICRYCNISALTISLLNSKNPAPASAAINIVPIFPLPEYSSTKKQIATFCTTINAVSPNDENGNLLRTLYTSVTIKLAVSSR